MNHKQWIGKWGENEAEQYLTQKGLVTLEKNVRTPYGEIDLVMRDGKSVVFVEVKTRTNDRYGMPEDAITITKRSHMLAAAESYIQSSIEPQTTWRIDVVSVRGAPAGSAPEVLWFESAIS